MQNDSHTVLIGWEEKGNGAWGHVARCSCGWVSQTVYTDRENVGRIARQHLDTHG